MEKKRIAWIDRLKGVAFIFVIIGHLKIGKTFKSWIYSFHMPLFLIATGLTMNFEKIYKTSFKDFFVNHAKKMLIPYFWMEMVSFCFRQIVIMIKHRGEVPVLKYLLGILVGNNALVNAPSNPLYYVLILFLAELVIWAIVRISKADRIKITFCAVLLLPLGLILTRKSMVWHISCIPVAVFFIILGNLLMLLYTTYREKLEKLNIFKHIASILVLFALGYFCWKFNGRFSFHGNYYGKDFVVAAAAAVFTGTAIAFCVMRLPSAKLLDFVGRNTLFYMGIHKPLLLVFSAMFRKYNKTPEFFVGATVACVLVLIPAVLISKRFFPFVMGITTEKPDKLQKLGQYAVVFASFCIPYNYFLNHFNSGLLKSSVLYTALSCCAYLVLTLGFWLITSKFVPVLYLSKKEPKEVPESAKSEG